MPATSLLDYTDSLGSMPSPFPPQSARKSRREYGYPTLGAWPVDMLPASALAVDLARRGVTFQRGTGYAVHGTYREPDQIARMAADLLAEVAEALPVARVATLSAWIAETEAHVERAYFATMEDDTIPYDDLGDALTTATAFAGSGLIAASHGIESETEADELIEAERWAIRKTVAELQTSSTTRRRLLDAVRPYLPTRSATDGIDLAPALAFLASFDERQTLRRSELSALYSEADSPSSLPPAALRALAAERWGEPRMLHGFPTYRPSASTPPPAPDVPATSASANPFPHGARPATRLAMDYTARKHAYDGTIPEADTLAALFVITPEDAALALDHWRDAA